MHRNNLFTKTGINDFIALNLYRKASFSAGVKARNSSKGSFAGEEIGMELNTIFEPYLLEIDLIDPDNYNKIRGLIENWRVDHKEKRPEFLSKFAAIQQILMNSLPECKDKQIASRNFSYRGFDYLMQGKFAWAISDFTSAICFNPKNNSAHENLELAKKLKYESERDIEDIRDDNKEIRHVTLCINTGSSAKNSIFYKQTSPSNDNLVAEPSGWKSIFRV